MGESSIPGIFDNKTLIGWTIGSVTTLLKMSSIEPSSANIPNSALTSSKSIIALMNA